MMRFVMGLSALLLTAPAMAATTFNGSYTITANNPGNPGLEIMTEKLADPFNFSLNLNQSVTFDLFRIWTQEASVNWLPGDNDDVIPRPISIAFSFTTPTGPGGAVTGTTNGVNLIVLQFGRLDWANGGTQTFDFGNNNKLTVQLANVTFNSGPFGLRPGYANGANVAATFTLTAVPEPASWAMMIGGFAVVGAMARRRSPARVLA